MEFNNHDLTYKNILHRHLTIFYHNKILLDIYVIFLHYWHIIITPFVFEYK